MRPSTPGPGAPCSFSSALTGASWVLCSARLHGVPHLPASRPAVPGLGVPLCLAHSYAAVKTQHLCCLFQEASLDCSTGPAGLHICTSSTFHVLLCGEGTGSVSVSRTGPGAPGAWDMCLTRTSASPELLQAWFTEAQSVSLGQQARVGDRVTESQQGTRCS